MEQIIKLDEEDIRALVAKEFNVEEEKVFFCFKKVIRGCGINEYEDLEICVTVYK